MKEYEVFVPLFHNDGTSVDGTILQSLQDDLLNEFGGVTFFCQPNLGFWKLGDVTFRDDIVLYRVLARNDRASRKFMLRQKESLKRDLKQEEILIIVRTVTTL
jgi:hypothetical protein